MDELPAGEGPHRLDVAIGQRVRERRRALGMSQQDLAEQLGVSFQQVQKYERGANRVSFSRLVETAAALRCTLGDLAEGLDSDRAPREIEQVNGLMMADGALEMLEAYAALPSDALRRAVLHHLRALIGALAGPHAQT
ncbi:helix-turn-helix domain-containing protein [Phenylobacterium sp.]|uniref:helix-turn-helix domain-containing protein n=1 Tax=Phenylobacterium sp. TaxID=1871053 RepID=UPI002DF022A2|nr:helix-turn-helix domain-containing protein [Phenylobacterium sp.]